MKIAMQRHIVYIHKFLTIPFLKVLWGPACNTLVMQIREQWENKQELNFESVQSTKKRQKKGRD